MKFAKQDLVRLLHTEGDNATADKVAAALPEEIDTYRDADALAAVGLDQSHLLAKLAAGSTGPVIP